MWAKGVDQVQNDFVFGIVDCRSTNVTVHASNLLPFACTLINIHDVSVMQVKYIPSGVPSWATPTDSEGMIKPADEQQAPAEHSTLVLTFDTVFAKAHDLRLFG